MVCQVLNMGGHPLTVASTVDWNPRTYEEVLDPHSTPYDAYCVSKKFAEKALWKFAEEHPEISVASGESFLNIRYDHQLIRQL